MKKLIFFIALIFGAVSVQAQLTLKTKGQKVIDGQTWYYSFSPASSTPTADSLGVVQDSIAIPIYIASPDSTFGYFRVKLKEVTSPANIIVQYQVKSHVLDSWTTAVTKTYAGTGTDTTIKFKSIAPYISYQYQRVLLIRSANKAYLEDGSVIYKK